MPGLSLISDSHGHGELEDLLDSFHLLATTFHVRSTHPPGNGSALFWRDRGQALSLQKVDAGTFRAKIGFQADEN